MLLRVERSLCVSIDCDDPPRSWHLELEISIVWHCIESSECSPSEQCVIAAAKGDDIEDQLLASEVVRGSEDHFQCYRAHQDYLQRSHTKCRGPLYGFNHTQGYLRISGQLPKLGVNLRYRPLSQRLSRTARTNHICKVQCGAALCIPQSQDARPSRSHYGQRKH